jgi:tyrosyl-tRNA synthetase
MGKTAAGAVWLSPERTSPFDFYQYFVNVDDRDVGRFLKLLTFLPMDEIRRLETLKGAELRVAKQALAFATTAIVHGKEAAETAQNAARAAFGGGGGDLVPTHVLKPEELAAGAKVVDVLAATGLAASKSVARRLIEQGGVRLGDRKIVAVDEVIQSEEIGSDGALLYAGKKHVRRLVGKS